MTRFLFWNLHRKNGTIDPSRATAIRTSLTRLVAARQLDVLVFAEYELEDAAVKAALDAAGVGTFHRPRSRSKRLVIWSRWEQGAIMDRYNGAAAIRMTIRLLLPSGGVPAWLVAAHLWDRTTLTTEAGRTLATSDISDAIRSFETRNKSSRTILVGDLNLNPFEAASVAPPCLHGLMTAQLARTVRDLNAREKHPTFYNPMRGLFGDRTHGPAGTYFWRNADEPTNHFWHMYDQVLIRPDLIDAFVGVEIVADDGTDSFLTAEGRPRTARYSDHLPLLFELDLTR